MKYFNKLVRDKIPDIIENSGRRTVISLLDDIQFYHHLLKKLEEEVKEFVESDNIEEIADILEVLDSIIKAKGIDKETIRKIQDEKRMKNGGFEEKIFLIKTLE